MFSKDIKMISPSWLWTFCLSLLCCACFCNCEDKHEAEMKRQEEERIKKNEGVRSKSKELIESAKISIDKKDFVSATRIVNDLKKANVQGTDMVALEKQFDEEKAKYDREQNEKLVQSILPTINQKIESGEGIEAFGLLQQGYKLVPEHPELKTLEPKILPLKEAQETQKRKEKIEQSIVIAENTIKNKRTCQELPTELKSTFVLIESNVKKGDEFYPKAKKVVAGLEKCRPMCQRG